MQLMDSLNRLGNENVQLMRELEEARAARAEAKAAKDMMARFKNEYGTRFAKVKEALKKYPVQQGGGAGGADIQWRIGMIRYCPSPLFHPLVAYHHHLTQIPIHIPSAYMKSSSMLEIQKRDETIKRLTTDLKKEREEVKRKDGALQKYEAFYREVKARSAEKARQRQLQEKQMQTGQKQQQQQRIVVQKQQSQKRP